VPPPPVAGSSRQALDVAWSEATLKLRGSVRWDLGIRDADLSFPAAAGVFSCAMGIPLNEADTPALYRLLRRTLTDLLEAPRSVKDLYPRERLRRDGAYPSGHAAVGWGWALILAELSPDRAEVILARGRAFGDSRTVCNVH